MKQDDEEDLRLANSLAIFNFDHVMVLDPNCVQFQSPNQSSVQLPTGRIVPVQLHLERIAAQHVFPQAARDLLVRTHCATILAKSMASHGIPLTLAYASDKKFRLESWREAGGVYFDDFAQHVQNRLEGTAAEPADPHTLLLVPRRHDKLAPFFGIINIQGFYSFTLRSFICDDASSETTTITNGKFSSIIGQDRNGETLATENPYRRDPRYTDLLPTLGVPAGPV